MSRLISDLSERIQHLLDARKQHADALAHIESTLGRIGAALGPQRRGRKPGRPAAADGTGAIVAATPTKRRRKRKSFATTAEEFVLAFVKANRNPTTRDINQGWKSEGRRATADNALTKLTKEKKLKRTPVGKGVRGSRYSLA